MVTWARRIGVVGFFILGAWTPQDSQEPRGIPVDQFATLYAQIKTQPGESLFWEIPWLLDFWGARRKAAEEGKPMLVWSGAGGPPIGIC